MDVSALLAQYLSVKAQVNYNQLQETKWSGLHEAMSAKLSQQTNAETKWVSASDTIIDKNGEADITKGGVVYCKKDAPVSGKVLENRAVAYANMKVPKYDSNKLEEYANLDMEYDNMQTTYETLLEELNAQSDSLKTTLGNATKDTGMLES